VSIDDLSPEDRPDVQGAFAAGGHQGAANTNRSVNNVVDEQTVNPGWFDEGTTVIPSRRTSLIYEPASGRIPYSDAGRKMMESAPRQPMSGFAGPEDFNLITRCLASVNAGPPMRAVAYNNNLQIIQSQNYVALLNEMIHEVRIVPLDNRPRVPDSVQMWNGSARGHWEKDTLVVESTNFRPHVEGWPFFASAKMKLVERFSRIGPNTLEYEFEVSDPVAYTQTWKGEYPMKKTADQIYEYACHEGNWSVGGSLKGARVEEQKAAAHSK
jgi:hypothetical protein